MQDSALGEAIAAIPMYGKDSNYDGICHSDYDPWVHAKSIGLTIVYREDLPQPEMVACYSEKYKAIFVRPNLSSSVERCAIAHEIVHFEHADVGPSKLQEDRADRIAANRLIREFQLLDLYSNSENLASAAIALNVTEHIMLTYVRNRRNRNYY